MEAKRNPSGCPELLPSVLTQNLPVLPNHMSEQMRNEFEKAARKRTRGGFIGEVWGFLGQTKKWWLLPILVILLIFGLLVFLSSTGMAPFIYTLF